MDPLRDLYAPPQDEREPVDDEASPREPREARVGGGLRLLASLVTGLPFLVVAGWIGADVYHAARAGSIASQASSSLYRLVAPLGLLWTVIESACEIALAASPGMLLFGLRVARADGVRPTAARLAAKALLVRVPQVPTVPATIAASLILVVPALARSPLDAIANSGNGGFLGHIGTITLVAWTIGWLFAFGARRQTHVDRMLDLAVFRKSDVRASGPVPRP